MSLHRPNERGDTPSDRASTVEGEIEKLNFTNCLTSTFGSISRINEGWTHLTGAADLRAGRYVLPEILLLDLAIGGHLGTAPLQLSRSNGSKSNMRPREKGLEDLANQKSHGVVPFSRTPPSHLSLKPALVCPSIGRNEKESGVFDLLWDRDS